MKPIRKLAIATWNLQGLTGKVRLIQENLPFLNGAGWQVHLYAQQLDEHRFAASGAALHSLSRPRLTRLQRMQWFDWRVQRHTRKGFDLVVGHGQTLKQDVAHIHNCYLLEAEATGDNDIAQSPAAIMQHRLLQRGEYQQLIVNSKLMRTELERRYGIDPARMSVVHPGVDTDCFTPPSADESRRLRKQFDLPQDKILIGLVTSGNFRKRGVDQFIAAASKLPKHIAEQATLVIVGNERDSEQYSQLASHEGLDSRFFASMPAIESLFSAIDIVVHPARLEEFGMGVLEAMSCGKAVLTNHRVGAAELIPASWSDWIADDGEDADLLSKQLALLIESPALVRHMGEDLRKVAEKNSWTHNAAQHLSVYQSVFESKLK